MEYHYDDATFSLGNATFPPASTLSSLCLTWAFCVNRRPCCSWSFSFHRGNTDSQHKTLSEFKFYRTRWLQSRIHLQGKKEDGLLFFFFGALCRWCFTYFIFSIYAYCLFRLGSYKQAKVLLTSLTWTWPRTHIRSCCPSSSSSCCSFRNVFPFNTVTEGKMFLKIYLPCQWRHNYNQWVFYN